MNINMVFKDDEFNVLFAAAGGKNFYRFGEEHNISDKEVAYIIHELTKRGILTEFQEEFSINEPYLSAIRGIKEAVGVLSIMSLPDEVYQSFFYIGTNWIRMSDSENDDKSVRLSISDSEELVKLVDEFYQTNKIKNFPDELADSAYSDEKAEKTNSIRYEVVNDEKNDIVAEWILYRGEYHDFVEENRNGRRQYIGINDWSSQRIVDCISAIRRES